MEIASNEGGENLSKIFFISDLHFGHTNVIMFDTRPFNNIEHMEQALISNWNSVVSNQDITYILGDFCWKAQESEWIRLLDQLNGNKVLIKGNHDLKSYSKKLQAKFQDIKDYKEITVERKHAVLCHYPIIFPKAAYNPDTVMLHGHVHLTRENSFLNKWRREIIESRKEGGDAYGNIYNVGCMMPYMGYTPRTISEIIEGVDR